MVTMNFGVQVMQPKDVDATLGLVCLTTNENFVLFLATLMEYHLNDVRALTEFI